jgi:hypothetical protein
LSTAPESALASVASWIFGGTGSTAGPWGLAITEFYLPGSSAERPVLTKQMAIGL